MFYSGRRKVMHLLFWDNLELFITVLSITASYVSLSSIFNVVHSFVCSAYTLIFEQP